jgi:hypothetical protein
VLANDTDGVDVGEALTVTAVTQGAHGSVSFTAAGVSYTPDANFFGSGLVHLCDQRWQWRVGHVRPCNVTVTNVNDDPVANDDVAIVAEDSSDNAIDVLANDDDGADTGESLTVTAVTQGPTVR